MVIAVCSLAVVADRERASCARRSGRRAGRRAGLVPALDEARRRSPSAVAAAASPIDDVRGTAAYRRHALRVLAEPRAGAGADVRIELTRQRRGARGRRLAGREPALRAARAARAARLEERVRAGRVRLVLGAARRQARLRVPRARGAGGRARGRHGRGARRGRRAPSRAGGVRRGGRRAVRLLHAGPGRRDRGPARRTGPTRARTRSARRSPATSAAVPATRRSSTRCDWRRAGMTRAEVTTTAAPATQLEVGRIGESVRRADGIPKTTGEFEYASDLRAAGMLWGHTVRSPHAHARIVEIDISEALAMPGVHAVLTHADVPGAEDLRPRVPGPAGAGDRPRPLLRRAGRARRRGAPGAGAAGGRAGEGRVRAARARRRHGARDRAGAAAPGPPDDGSRLPRRSAAERRPAHGHPPRRPRDRRATSASRASTRSGSRIRRSSGPSRGSPFPTGRAASTSTSRRSGCTSTATRSRPASASSRSRCGSTSPVSGGAFGGREDLSMQIHGAMLALHTSRPVKLVYAREESFVGHVHRHPAKIWCEHRATKEGRLVCVRMRILLDGGAYASQLDRGHARTPPRSRSARTTSRTR